MTTHLQSTGSVAIPGMGRTSTRCERRVEREDAIKSR